MPGIIIREGQSIELALKLLKKQVEKANIIKELRNRRHFEKPSVKKKRKSEAARKRLAKQQRMMSNQ